MRLTRKVFNDLALFMMAFGFSIGVVFPFFVTLLGVPKQYTLTGTFFIACIGAGLVAGLVNYFIARKIVGNRLKTLSDVGQHMKVLAQAMRDDNGEGNAKEVDFDKVFTSKDLCGEMGCHIEVDSDDEFGESAKAFNLLAETLSLTISTERAARSFTHLLTTHLDLNPLAEKAIRKLVLYTGSTGGLLAVVEQGELKEASHYGITSPENILKSSIVLDVVRKNQAQTIEIPASEHITVDHVVGEHRAKHVLVYPILYKSVALGVIILVSKTEYSNEILRRLDLLSVGLGLALNNSLTHGRMRVLATLDPLTSIYNRGFGVKRLHEEYTRSVRNHSPLGVIIFDIDDFKAINDTFGHLVGDRALISVVKMAEKMLREGDILIRYGGEEFMAVLPGASLEDVRQVGDRIRRAVDGMRIIEDEQSVHLTVSLGGVSYPELNVSSEEALVRHADTSLYLAKNSGKNKIELNRTQSSAI
jgi:diguanylate cyclase (GGDEF)-like protein